MKKLFSALYFLLFAVIVAALFWAISYNIKNPQKEATKVDSRVKKSSIIKGKVTTKRGNKRLSKELKRAKDEPLVKRLKATKTKFGDRVFIRIFKKERHLEVWIKPKSQREYKLLKLYSICYYSGRLGPKLKEGDYQAPEGFYRVYKRSLNPHSHYHLSFNLGYPNSYDRAHKRTGSYLMVHGKCVSTGCYAMGDRNIEEIYKLVKSALFKGQAFVWVDIFPFRLSKENLAKYKTNRWYKFWKNLKEGYDIFDKRHIPPSVGVKDKEYSFGE